MDVKCENIISQIEKREGITPIKFEKEERVITYRVESDFDLNHLIQEFKRLNQRVEELERKEKFVILREINMEEAEKEIMSFIKAKADKRFNDLEIMEILGIPIEQIDSVLEKLQKEGNIRAR